MKIAITGVTGDIGGAYMNSIENDDVVKVLLRKDSRAAREDAQIYSFEDGFTYDSAFLNNFVESDTLVHCAALLNSSEYGLEDVIAVNAMLTGALAVSALRQDVKKLVYISSEMVYTLPQSGALDELSNAFLVFCQENFSDKTAIYDLRALSKKFVSQNAKFPFAKYNSYALTKYLGEVIVKNMPNAAILRVSSAYGPEYTNPRLIPRMIRGRLTGHEVEYIIEKRDFVYSTDINNLIATVIRHDVTGIIDCKSGEEVSIEDLADTITRATPTAYGILRGTPKSESEKPIATVQEAEHTLTGILGAAVSFRDGLTSTIRRHKEHGYHQMTDGRTLQDFLKPDERIVKVLKGSSAAHLCVVADSKGIQKVRKIAIYDGVEGNGIAKVANEIKYYQHITKHEPNLASMYPKLLDAEIDETFSSETIEYLDGKNYYQSLKDGVLPEAIHRKSLVNFLAALSECVLENCTPSKDPDGNLDNYYVERSLSRLHPIGDVITIHDELLINDKPYIAPHIILADLLTNEKLRALVRPQIESFCFHGDLTFLNTVLVDESREIKLIDPRGFIGNWDPLYDFAKLQFSLGGFGEFIVSEKPMVTQAKEGEYMIHFDQIPDLSKQLHDEFLDLLEADVTFKNKVIDKEPHWRHRIMLAKATHFLADIPFRLFTDGTTSTALSSYVIGTYYLNQAYEALKNETNTSRKK